MITDVDRWPCSDRIEELFERDEARRRRRATGKKGKRFSIEGDRSNIEGDRGKNSRAGDL